MMAQLGPAMALCYPSKSLPSCSHCLRRRCGEPPDAERRLNLVIDAAAGARNGICGMFELRRMPARRCTAQERRLREAA